MAMLYTLPLSSKLTSLEGAPLLAEFAEKQLRERVHPKAHFQVITTRFSDWMINHPDARPEFVFLDGDHTEAATTANGSWFLDRIPAGGALVVDDIYWSPGMARAWRSLKAHPRVSVWVDAFHLGILFVERQQAREGFCVRV
jgi:predicted O-methyltransferase YrrM